MSQPKTKRSTLVQAPSRQRRSFAEVLRDVGTRRLLLDLGLLMAGSIAISLAFPDTDLWPLAWVGPVLILASFWHRPAKQVFWMALAGGTVTNVLGFYWMNYLLTVFGHLPGSVSFVVVLLGAAWQALSIAVAYTSALHVSRRTSVSLVWTLPIAYTALEYVHPILFPWFLGNCQYPVLWLTQIADLVGVSGVTFVVVMCSAAGWLVFRRLWHREPISRQVWAAPVVLVATLAYGGIRLHQIEQQQESAPVLKVGVVEPEIGIFEEQRTHFPPGESPIQILRWNLLRHQWDTRRVASQDVDLVMWPESSYFPVLSSLAHRQEPDVWLFSGTSVVGLDLGTGPRPAVELGQQPAAVVSAGEDRTWVAGKDGAVWRLASSKAEEVKRASAAALQGELTAGALPCIAQEGMEETSWQKCYPVFVGRHGTMLTVTDSGVEPVPPATNRDLLTVAAFSPRLFVAAGEEVALLVSLDEGIVKKLELPPKRWLFSALVQRRVMLVSSDGTIAEVSDSGEARAHRAEELKRHDILGAASPDGQSLLIATHTGLLYIGSDSKEWVAEGLQVESLSCDGTGQCALVESSGNLRFLSGKRLTAPAALPHSGPWNVASVPFTRYLWWIPEDARRIYQSQVPLPVEAPYPAPVLADIDTAVRDINAPQRGFGKPLLFGAIAGTLVDPEDPSSLANTKLNSAFLVDEMGLVLGRYDKQYLLAFGEYLPGGSTFPWLYDLIPESGRFAQGPNRDVLLYDGRKLGILICYEDLLTAHTRQVVQQGAEVLLNLTNDAWFGKTKEPDQHFVLASFRAIEYRKALVRSTCTGISGVVLPSGEIVQRTGLFGAEQFVQAVPLMQGSTVFATGGFLFPWILLAAWIALLASSRRRETKGTYVDTTSAAV